MVGIIRPETPIVHDNTALIEALFHDRQVRPMLERVPWSNSPSVAHAVSSAVSGRPMAVALGSWKYAKLAGRFPEVPDVFLLTHYELNRDFLEKHYNGVVPLGENSWISILPGAQVDVFSYAGLGVFEKTGDYTTRKHSRTLPRTMFRGDQFARQFNLRS